MKLTKTEHRLMENEKKREKIIAYLEETGGATSHQMQDFLGFYVGGLLSHTEQMGQTVWKFNGERSKGG